MLWVLVVFAFAQKKNKLVKNNKFADNYLDLNLKYKMQYNFSYFQLL